MRVVNKERRSRDRILHDTKRRMIDETEPYEIDVRYSTDINKKVFADAFNRKMDENCKGYDIDFYYNSKNGELLIDYNNESAGEKETLSMPFYKFITNGRFNISYEEDKYNYQLNEKKFPETKYDLKSKLKEAGAFNITLFDIVDDFVRTEKKIPMSMENLFDGNLYTDLPKDGRKFSVIYGKQKLRNDDYDIREHHREMSNFSFNSFYMKYMHHDSYEEKNPFTSLDVISKMCNCSMNVYYKNADKILGLHSELDKVAISKSGKKGNRDPNTVYKKTFETIPYIQLVDNSLPEKNVLYDGQDVIDFTNTLLSHFSKDLIYTDRGSFYKNDNAVEAVEKLFTIDRCHDSLNSLLKYCDDRNLSVNHEHEMKTMRSLIDDARNTIDNIYEDMYDETFESVPSDKEEIMQDLVDKFLDETEKNGFVHLNTFFKENNVEKEFNDEPFDL